MYTCNNSAERQHNVSCCSGPLRRRLVVIIAVVLSERIPSCEIEKLECRKYMVIPFHEFMWKFKGNCAALKGQLPFGFIAHRASMASDDGDFERQKEVNLPTNSCEFVRNCRSRPQHGASCLTSKVRKMEPRLVIGLETNSRAYSSSAGQMISVNKT